MGDWEYGVLPPKEAFPKAMAAATKALALDNALGEAHTSLAFSLDLFDWDWQSAEREYKQAVELSPSYATAHQWYAWHLIVLGRNSEAVTEMRRAESLDPLLLSSARIWQTSFSSPVSMTNRYNKAERRLRWTLTSPSHITN